MIKVRVLDSCEFFDGEVSTREAIYLTVIDILGFSPLEVAVLTQKPGLGL